MKISIILLLAVMVLTGCTSRELIWPDVVYDDQPVDENGVPVKLSGVIDAGAETRGAGVINGPSPSSNLSLDVFRADMGTNLAYTATYASRINGTLLETGNITLDPEQSFFPNADIKTKFVALYPVGDTYNQGNGSTAPTVTYSTIDGAMDIMCSGFGQGDKNDPAITLLLEHLLTKIRVDVKAEGSTADEINNVKKMWGKVTNIQVQGKKTGAKVTLPVPNAASPAVKIAITGTPGNLPLTTVTGTPPAHLTLTDDAQPFGYAMFVPVTTTSRLTLLITTEYSSADLSLTTADSQTWDAGKGYVINVGLSVGGAAVTSVTGGISIDDWDDQDTAVDGGVLN
jgi:hypothetical protein